MSLGKLYSPLEIAIIGNCDTGKSSLAYRISDSKFTGNYFQTIGIDYRVTSVNVQSKGIDIRIWDTSSTFLHMKACIKYIIRVAGMIVAYDITNRDSFSEVEQWLNLIERNFPFVRAIILCGTKADLKDQRQVSKIEGEELAFEYNMSFFETSSKDDTYVTDLFETAAAEML
ncbi:unnamed protein product [Moneuplotes crassus]|uniref:Uncharacterized protein n=1 Tax=Euplotes crassus TaxID=5936 RepID=A0AAD1Y1U0_EUPCR|nr:unnamed protein product [Moneuplotes crassus]